MPGRRRDLYPPQSELESQQVPYNDAQPNNPRSQPDLRVLRQNRARELQTPLDVRLGRNISDAQSLANQFPPKPVVTVPSPVSLIPHFLQPNMSIVGQWQLLVPANPNRRALYVMNSYSPTTADDDQKYITFVSFGSPGQIIRAGIFSGIPIMPVGKRNSAIPDFTYTGSPGYLAFDKNLVPTQDVYVLLSTSSDNNYAVMAYEGIDSTVLAPG
jgi:hypothetical protein